MRAKRQYRARKKWPRHYDARLRRYFGFPDKLTDEQLAELFDYEFAPETIRHRRMKLGLVRHYPHIWTADEDQRLRELAYTMSWGDVALAIGQTSTGVFQRAMRLGITRPMKGKSYAALGLTDFIRQHHARSWTDTKIESAWNRRHPEATITRSCVSERRRNLALPNNAWSDRQRKRVAKKTREQLERMGLKNLAQLRVHSWAQFAARAGWPGYGLRPRAVQVLNLLYERGPHPRREICQALGLRWKSTRQNGLAANGGTKYPDRGGTYLSELMKAGLVVRMRGVIRTKRRGSHPFVYAVAPHVKRRPPCPRKETA